MYSIVVRSSLLLSFSLLVFSDGVHRRQTQPSSSMSVPMFSYGYYSQIYPNGEVTTGVSNSRSPTATGMKTPTKSSSAQPRATSAAAAGSGPGGPNFGPVAASQEEAFIASVCQPVNNTNQPDLNFPCNKLLLYETPCIYGQSYEELLKSSRSDSLAPPLLSANEQLKCFCKSVQGQNYWQNSL
ncbi:MAG: hypothetical protein Q9181_003858 [Wetmoreana brouardii]